MDLASKNPRYLEFTDMSPWHNYLDGFFSEVLFKLIIPEPGAVVEFGTFRCVSFLKLCQHYGEHRCIGYDVVNYADHPLVRTQDVRDLKPTDDFPMALAWNDISNWKSSPESKFATAKFSLRNVLVGGLYIDECVDAIPPTLDLSDFELLFAHDHVSLFRRIKYAGK